MPTRGFALAGTGGSPWVGNYAPLEALRLAIPDEEIARTNTQEQRRRRLPSELVVALVVGLGLWALTSLLDPAQCSAHTLAVTYHERREVETTIDELRPTSLTDVRSHRFAAATHARWSKRSMES